MKQLLIDHIPFSVAKLTLTEAKVGGNGRLRLKGKLQEAEQARVRKTQQGILHQGRVRRVLCAQEEVHFSRRDISQ